MTEVKFTLPSIGGLWASLLGVASKVDILHISLVGAALRLLVFSFPNDGGLIFDEVHYHNAALAILDGVAANAEHPPLVKLFAALSIKFLGDFWFAWRIPTVLFAVFIPYLVYRLAWKLTGSKQNGLYAAAFSLFDIILFIHGNILMLEIPALVLSLAFALLYLEKRSGWAAVAMSFAFLCNEKALWILLGVAIYHVWSNPLKKTSFKADAKKVGVFLAVCLVFGGGGLWLNDLVWKPASNTSISVGADVIVYQNNATAVTTTTSLTTHTSYEYITNPISHVLWMFGYYTGLNAGIPQSTEGNHRPPIGWVTPLGDNWDNPPVYLKTVVSVGDKSQAIIDYRGQSSYPIWWMTLPILALCAWLWRRPEAKFILSWVAVSFGFWVAWEMRFANLTFNHYFLFTIPIICVGIPWFWSTALPKYSKQIIGVHLAAAAVFFAYYFPVVLYRVF
jgi:hypothetical protein